MRRARTVISSPASAALAPPPPPLPPSPLPAIVPDATRCRLLPSVWRGITTYVNSGLQRGCNQPVPGGAVQCRPMETNKPRVAPGFAVSPLFPAFLVDWCRSVAVVRNDGGWDRTTDTRLMKPPISDATVFLRSPCVVGTVAGLASGSTVGILQAASRPLRGWRRGHVRQLADRWPPRS